ncbi:MAG: arabinose isomerase [Chitinophagaceae bacterium]|nr:MAG: arabinose isomerase [Chitinophagaceae bacterium]
MIKIGLFGIGLDTYWPQFEGLLDRLKGYQQTVAQNLASTGAFVHNEGIIDNPESARQTAEKFVTSGVDAVFLFIATYALSHNLLPVLQRLKVPLVVLNLQPEKAIDYAAFNATGDRGQMTGEWLAYCQSCVAPEIASVLNRSGNPFYLISGYLHEPYVWREVDEYVSAMTVQKAMRNNRVGLLGHYYNGMMDVYADLTQQVACFGNHFEIIEIGVLKALRDGVTEEEVAEKIRDFQASFLMSRECAPEEILRAAKTSVALDKLVLRYNLGSLAYYYEGEGDAAYLDIVSSLIPGLTLLTGRQVPVAGEYEVKNVQAMKIMDVLGCGGSFSEFYALDFDDEIVLLGHDGPAHFSIADGKVDLVPLPVYHGKPGKGLSIQMKVKSGPVTLLSVGQGVNGKLFLLVAEGVSEDGPTLQIGNTNSRYRFSLPVREFIDRWSKAGPSHHCAIGIGHKARVLQKLASLLQIECVQIC